MSVLDPEFLTVEDVEELHAMQIERFGGTGGLRDRGGLEAAVGMASQAFGGEYLHADLYAMAAAYAFHIAQRQPFLDGNKRAGLHAALTFLMLNAIELPLTAEDRLYSAMIQVATHDLDKAGLAELLRELDAK